MVRFNYPFSSYAPFSLSSCKLQYTKSCRERCKVNLTIIKISDTGKALLTRNHISPGYNNLKNNYHGFPSTPEEVAHGQDKSFVTSCLGSYYIDHKFLLVICFSGSGNGDA